MREFWGDGNFLYPDCGGGHRTLNFPKPTKLYTKSLNFIVHKFQKGSKDVGKILKNEIQTVTND